MNIGDVLGGISTFDLLIILVLGGAFVLGYAQGTIRRLVGIISMVFAFFLAVNLKDTFGKFLGENWEQFAPEYGEMLGMLIVFGAAIGATTLVIQGTYSRTPIFAKYEFLDELIGGFLGVFQAAMFLTFLVIILDTFFLRPFAVDEDEYGILRSFWTAVDSSGFGNLLHDTVIPRFLDIVGFLVPESIRALYP